ELQGLAPLREGHSPLKHFPAQMYSYLENAHVGREKAAITLYREALAVYERTFGPGGPRASAVQTAMAETYRAVGRPTEAARIEHAAATAAYR
ncbi:MAG TPA: tetratricopeptide repeat protein, partial [Bryobacteraceae bacterium]|nr:tetratricopeptide repeat protein [Bryobacteraceae bacterium]